MIKEYSYHEIGNDYKMLKGKRVIIWCESVSGLNAYVKFHNLGIDVIGFADSFADRQETFAGLPSYSLVQLAVMDNFVIYIATCNMEYVSEILEKLEDLKDVEVYANGYVYGAGEYDVPMMKEWMKSNEKKIQFVSEHLEDEKSKYVFDKLLEYRVTNRKSILSEIEEKEHRQYFPGKDILKPDGDEIFIDAGAYNGDTSREFCEWVAGEYSKIWLLEPDSLMYQVMKEYIRLKGIKNAIPVNKGAYSYTGKIAFKEDSATGSSMIDAESGEDTIEVISIDDILNGESATYIKMDIEGAEKEALEGAERTIKTYKPKLVVCIYHKPDDLWELPYYIMQKYPWYKIYIRHYSFTSNETVMYAAI